MQEKYDYIMAGGGLSGLVLTLQLLDSSLHQKRILIIDQEEKDTNDRTWCFWATETDQIPNIDIKRWQYCHIHNTNFHKRLDINPYTYRMIRGIDFYKYACKKINQFPNVERKKAVIKGIDTKNGIVQTSQGNYEGTLIFKSYFHPTNLKIAKPYVHLLQHFKGWYIETPQPMFDDKEIRLMDFRVPQNKDTRFVYLLPISPTKALVEYTIFSPMLLEQTAYDSALKAYVKNNLSITDYKIVEEEFNVIPMTDYTFTPKIDGKVVNIGTIGGFVKASSGYCFKRTFEKTRQIVNKLEKGEQITEKTFSSPYRFRLYDSILLWAFERNLVSGSTVFSNFFKRLPDNQLLRFLDERTHFGEEISVFLSGPPKFAWALMNRLKVLWKI